MNRRLHAIVICLGMALSATTQFGELSPAEAYCYAEEDVWTGYSAIPVRIHVDVPGELRHYATGNPWTMTEFSIEVRHVLQKINDYNGSALPPLYYAGTTTQTGFVPNQLNLVLNVDEGDCGWTGGCDGGPQNGCTVNIPKHDCRGPSRGDLHFNAYDPDYFMREGDNAAILLHEIGHAVGFKHPDECGGFEACTTEVCAVMGTSAGQQHFSAYFIDDTNGFRDMYDGNYDGTPEHFERHTGSWYELAGSYPPLHAPGAGLSDNASQGPYMAATVRTTNAQNLWFWRWVYTTQSWSYWGYLTEPGNGAVGAAYDASANTGFFAFQTGETNTFTEKKINWTKLTGYQLSPPSYVGSDATMTRRHGVDAAFDAQSGMLIMATRAMHVEHPTYPTEHWQILVHLVDPSTNSVLKTWALEEYDEPILAADTPSLACGPEVTADFNCVIVWEEAGHPDGDYDPYHVMRSMNFWIENFFGFWVLRTGTPVFIGPSAGEAYLAYGRPDVTYKGPTGSSSAFEVAWSSPQLYAPRTYTWTMQKSMNKNATWSGLRWLPYDSSHRSTPAIGAASGRSQIVRNEKP